MNATASYEFTMIVPIYNEAENMERLVSTLAAYLPKCSRRACVLFVDDGSTDGSLQSMKAVCQENTSFYYLSFQKNCGLSAAIKAGFDHAMSPLVGYIDADLQTTPEDFDLLLPAANEYELVMGIRAHRNDSLGKRLQSKIANSFRRLMTGDEAIDTGCPLKVLHSDVAKRMPMFTGMHRFMPALVMLQNGRTRQVPVRHFPRVAGRSKYHLWNRLVAPFMDCFAFRWMKKRWYNYQVGTTNLDGGVDKNTVQHE